MKTKFLFATMVLPALFAACTSEEFIDSTANPALEGRELLDPNFSINVVGDEADTRFSWNAEEYAWNKFTAEDKFSAGLVDVNGTVGSSVLTNYIFSSTDGVSYTTNSQMVEGTYAFYSYDGFESQAAREAIPFDLSGQIQTNLAKPDSIVNGSQLFIAPLYKLAAETANEPMDLTFVSYWSVAAIKLHNTSGQPLKLTSIMLNADASEAFAVKGTLDLEEMAKKYIYTYSETSDKYTFPKDVTYDDFRTAQFADVTSSNPVLAIDCQGYILENNAEVTAYMQVPANIYKKDMTVSVMIEDTDEFGTVTLELVKDVEKNAKNAATDAENNVIRFNRGKTTAVFGIEAGEPAAYEIDEIELNAATISSGAYAATYADIVKILTDETVRGNVDVNNAASLKLDDRVINAIYRSDIGINFLNPIEITTNSRTAADVRNVEFQGGATLTEGNINLVEGVELPAGQTLTISEGTKATVEDGTYEGTIVNNGTLTLGAENLNLTVENGEESAIVVAAENTIAAASTASVDEVVMTESPKTLTVDKNVTLNIANANNAYVVDWGKSVVNNGIIQASKCDYFVNKSTITNNGEINAVNNQNGDGHTATTPEVGKIENNGTINYIKNYAQVNMKSREALIETIAVNNGNIDNTIGGFIKTWATKSTDTGYVYAIYTTAQTGELGKVNGCNKVIVSGTTWTDPAVGDEIAAIEINGSTLAGTTAYLTTGWDMSSNSTVKSLSIKNSIVSINLKTGTVTEVVLEGSEFEDLTLNSSEQTELDVNGVTFNGNVTASSVTTLNIAGPKTGSATTTVNAKFTTGSATMTVAKTAILVVNETGSMSDITSATNEGKVRVYGSITTDGSTPTTSNGDWTVGGQGSN